MPSAPPAPTHLPAGIDGEAVFRSLFVAYPDALLVADADGSIVLANPSAAQLLGYTVEELVGLNVDALVPDVTRARHASYRQAYARNPRPRPMGLEMDLVAKRRDGSEVMVEIALSPLQAHGARLVVAAIRDIGAYPRVKQALKRARYSERLALLSRLAVDARDVRVLLNQAPVAAAEALGADLALVYLLEPNGLGFRIASGFGLLDGEGVGCLVPNRLDVPVGFLAAQGVPVKVDDYLVEQRFEVPAAWLRAGLRSGLGVPLTARGRSVGAMAVRSRERQRYGEDEVRFLESVCNLLATSLQRAQSEEALNHAQRLESVGQLTGGIAHDFNNLLTVIQGNLQVLEELPALAGDGHAPQLVAAAARATRRGAELTGKLLAFSRRQVLQPSAVAIDALLHSLADMLRRTLDQRIHIEVDAPDCPPCLADPGQLESALLNIAINARDAMPDGGLLRFRARPCDHLPDHVHRDLEPPAARGAAYVAIAISDTGAGMSDDVKEHAFEPFFTTKEAGRGTGLGLSTVYGFVKQSHGAVAIDSALGAGTTVTLYIPSLGPADAPAEPQSDDGHIPAGLRVLLVEDDADVRAVMHNFLATLGCQVTAFGSGEQALPVLAGDPPGGAPVERPFDLLLSDVALGAGMRGTEFAALAQARWPSLGVLLMSGFSAELLDADRDSPASWELLRKPCSREELAHAIARVLRG